MNGIPGAAPLIIGRDHESRLIDAALERAAGGRRAVVLVEGEPGIGTTALLGRTAAAAVDRGFDVIAGEAAELDATQPFGALVDILHSAAPDLLASIATEPLAQHQMIERFVAAIEARADSPVLLTLEDLHWADDASLHALSTLASRLLYVPLAIALTLRPTPRSQHLSHLVYRLLRDGAELVSLGPLAPTDAVDLARRYAPDLPPERLAGQVAPAQGNPLFVLELAESAVSDGGPPTTLRSALLRRTAGLPEATRELLTVAAVLGATFELSHLAIAQGASVVAVIRDLQPAIDAAVLVSDADGSALRFRHDLIHESLLGETPAAVRHALHRHIGEQLAAAGGPVHAVAHHLSVGASSGDETALSWLGRAHEAVRLTSPGLAAELLQRTLEVLPERDDRAIEAEVDLARTLGVLGRAAEAEQRVRARLDGADGAGRARLLRALADTLYVQGRWAEQVEVVERALAVPELEETDRARLLAERCAARVFLADLTGSMADHAEAIRLGTELGDAVAPVHADGALAAANVATRRFEEALDIGQRAVARALQDPTGESLRLQPQKTVVAALIGLGRDADAEHLARSGLEEATRLGLESELPIYHVYLGDLAFRRLDWDVAEAEYETALGVLGVHGREITSASALLALARLHLHRGDGARAGELVTEVKSITEEHGSQLGLERLPGVRATQYVLEGDPDRALSLLLARGPWESTIVGLVERLGATDRHAELAARLASAEPVGRVSAAIATGEHARVVAEVAGLGATPDRVNWANLAEGAALALQRLGQPSAAADLLAGAYDVWAEVDARVDLERVRQLLGELGTEVAPRPTRSGFDTLTDMERRVVGLVMQGLTHVQIGQELYISHRTVGTHVQHVYRKLGIHSRDELRTAAALAGVA